MNAPLIGARIERKEDYRFLTGAGQYTDDVTLPGQTYAAFVRSPHAHAAIKSIKKDKALKAPGVLAVFTGEFGGRNVRTFTVIVPPCTTVSSSASGSTVTPAASAIASVKSCSLKARRKSASAFAASAALTVRSASRAARTARRPSASGGTMRAGSNAS